VALFSVFSAPSEALADDATVAGPGSMSAAPNGDARVGRAREAFVAGVELAKVGRWNEARALFEQSDELLPHAVTTYNVGFCDRALGHYARAELGFSRALEEDARTPTLSDELRKSANTLLREIHGRIATATLVVETEGTGLLVDGRPLERVPSTSVSAVYLADARDPASPETLERGNVEVRLDPGTHVFQLARAARTGPDVVETFQPGETRMIRFPPLDARPSPAASATVEQVRGPVWPVITAGSFAGLGILTGTVFGILSITAHSALTRECGGSTCNPGRESEIERYHTYADVATGGFVIGGAALAVGAVLLLENHDPNGPGRITHGSRSGRVRVSVFPAGVAGSF
jgi:hypothetical protein